MTFSTQLQSKIDSIKLKQKPIQLGTIPFNSPLLLAPMASICNWPFRLLMQDLGAGGSVSELISAHAINHGNPRTMNMLKISPKEVNIGIQLFGEDARRMSEAAKVAQNFGPNFIDINMGCPVRKVVTKGGGSALLKSPKDLAPFLEKIKKSISIPLTIKIRMGWDAEGINADEIVHIAKEEGVEFVAIHGRTRAQQYTGEANWDYIEKLATESPLPLIGNGDLHQAESTRQRMLTTNCQALMIARGALRNPFIFLESLVELKERENLFTSSDYLEVIKKLEEYTCEAFEGDRVRLIQLRKLIVWFSSGFPKASLFRGQVFETKSLQDCMKYTEDFFLELNAATKKIDYNQAFMNSGHG